MTLTHSILVDAPPDVVWRVTSEVERWPEWTPTVTDVTLLDTAAFGPGSTARIKQPGQPASDWVVTEFTPGTRFTWETRRPGLHMVATHELHPLESGTRNVLRLEVTGVLAILLWPVLRLAVPRALSLENAGLKARCEALSAPHPGPNHS